MQFPFQRPWRSNDINARTRKTIWLENSGCYLVWIVVSTTNPNFMPASFPKQDIVASFKILIENQQHSCQESSSWIDL